MKHQSAAKKGKTLISSFFKKRDHEASDNTSIPTVPTMQHQSSESIPFPNIQIPSISSPGDDHQSSSTCIKLLQEVKVFCSRNEIDVPDLGCLYKIGRFRRQTTIQHHYHFDVFNAAIDFILIELNNRFNESSVKLLSLSTSLDLKNSFDSFNSDGICKLATKFYSEDFTDQDIVVLEYELIHYKLDVVQNLNVSTLVELCQQLTESGRSKVYVMLTRLIHLVLTLPMSTTTTERAFSAMKYVKTALRNKMEDDFLVDCLTLYIERDLAKQIDIDSIIDEFYALKSRRA